MCQDSIEKLREAIVRPFTITITQTSFKGWTTVIQPFVPVLEDDEINPPSDDEVTKLEKIWSYTNVSFPDDSSFVYHTYRRLYTSTFTCPDYSLDLEFAKLSEFVEFMIDTDCLAPWMKEKHASSTRKVKDLLLGLRRESNKFPEEREIYERIYLRDIPNGEWTKINGIKRMACLTYLNYLMPAIKEFYTEYFNYT